MAIPYSRYVFGQLPWYSVLIVTGILLSYWLGTREERRLGLPKDSMLDLTLFTVPCGIVGARLYYVAMRWDQFAANPISALYIWEGGIAIYGAVIGGAIALYCYARVRKVSFGALLDIASPGLVLAQALGRWGNYFNQEAYGPRIADAAWQFFPFGVLIEENGARVWHVATFFYESVWDLLCFGVLWLTRKRMKRRGDTFLWYLILYGGGRYLVEQLRTDSLYVADFRASQYLSLLFCLIAAAVFLCRLAKEKRGLPLLAAALCCALPFLRMLLPTNTHLYLIALAFYALTITLTLAAKDMPRFAVWWLIADALVYIGLLVFDLGWLWRSPYFAYAGMSLPIYLLIPYAMLPRAPQEAAA